MTMLDTAIADFGAILGFDPSDLANRDHVAMDIEGIGELHVERHDETLLVYLSRPIEVGADRLELYKSALRSVHFENGRATRVQCALHDNRIIFLSRSHADEVSVQALEGSLELLIELQEKAGA